VRYALAREFLALTDLPVGEVAAAVGFGSPGVFSETFRRWSGTTPSDWRRAQGNSTHA
jgi:AraC-like DNA-binding protein